ncbi:MAG: hypothetical protein H6757_06140 [Candidatus Omnitrophica bacterium]|nr:hypothetical protein [Candidatus Omnitrophota bacterium]
MRYDWFTGFKRRLCIGIQTGIGLFFILFFLGMASTPQAKESDRAQGLRALQSMADAFEKEDSNAFLDFVSDQYSPETKTEVEERIEAFFHDADQIRIHLVVDVILESQDHSSVVFQTHWQKSFLSEPGNAIQKQTGKTDFIVNVADNPLLESQQGDSLF